MSRSLGRCALFWRHIDSASARSCPIEVLAVRLPFTGGGLHVRREAPCAWSGSSCAFASVETPSVARRGSSAVGCMAKQRAVRRRYGQTKVRAADLARAETNTGMEPWLSRAGVQCFSALINAQRPKSRAARVRFKFGEARRGNQPRLALLPPRRGSETNTSSLVLHHLSLALVVTERSVRVSCHPILS